MQSVPLRGSPVFALVTFKVTSRAHRNHCLTICPQLGHLDFARALPTSPGSYPPPPSSSLGLSVALGLSSKSKWSRELVLVHCDEDEVPHVTAGIKIKAILPLQTPPFHLGLSPERRLAFSDPSAWDSWGRTWLPRG